jgi:hypothetical protein
MAAVKDWVGRIESIPDWFIESICKEAIGLGITGKIADAGIEFLKHRRTHFGRLLLDNCAEFRSIPQWEMF